MNNKIIGGRYELLEEIGNGGMAVVYKGYDKLLGRNVAVKILRQEFNSDNDFIQNFTAEARSAASIAHQNLVGIYDVGKCEEMDCYFIVMEYLKGLTLKDYIKQAGKIEWQEACSYILQILKGLSAAHAKGVIHRDIKPQNIMLLPNGVVKIMDFGIARAVSTKTVKIGGTETLGSAHYLSPEQAKGRHTDEKSDIYSLGIVLYEMLTGTLPFNAGNAISIAMMHISEKPKVPSEINPDIPPALDSVILHSINKNRNERYHTAAEMLEDVKQALRAPGTPIANTNEGNHTQKMTVVKNDAIEKLFNETPAVPAPRTKTPDNKAAPEDPPTKNEKKLKKATIITSCVFGFLFLLFITYAFFPGIFGGRKDIAVPDLVGMDINKVLEEYKDNKDISVIVDKREEDDEMEEDKIISQTPETGRKMRAPLEIKVVVSSGKKQLVLPDLEGLDENAAKAELRALGIAYITKSESSEDIEEGCVIKMSPKAGTKITDGMKVTLTISAGTKLEIKTPNFVGLTLEAAQRLATEKKLIISSSYKDSAEPAGTIISQTPGKGETITEGDVVKVVVSTGHAPATPTPKPPAPTATPKPAPTP